MAASIGAPPRPRPEQPASLRERPAVLPTDTSADRRPMGDDASVSVLHLAEGRSGWRLTITLTPDLLAAINGAHEADQRAAGNPNAALALSCRLHVEPNLVPGEPFAVDEIHIVAPPSTTSPDAGSPSSEHPEEGREAP